MLVEAHSFDDAEGAVRFSLELAYGSDPPQDQVAHLEVLKSFQGLRGSCSAFIILCSKIFEKQEISYFYEIWSGGFAP